MDTLLELYDAREPVKNLIGAWHLHPSEIIFFYYDLPDAAAERKQLAQLFDRIGLRCAVRMEQLEHLDVDGMIEWVQARQTELGEYAIELSGGDDAMLFSAGCCYERFPCKLYCSKTDGRYIELPSGREIKPRNGVMTVEQRLSLNDCRLDRYGRLTPDELRGPLLMLADRMLDLQRKHSRQWTGCTRCIQQCVSRAPEGALTVLLDSDTCRDNNVSAGKGKLLRQMERAGALTAIEERPDGILVTFPSLIVRDCLCDYGVWLEIGVYDAMRMSAAYDDVRMSCVVRWENERIANELDVTATAGMSLLIVSCKTCAPDMEALAELNVLGDRLGSTRTKTALAALPKGTERLDNMHARCEEMGVQLIDLRQYDKQTLIAYFKRLGDQLRRGRA